MQLNATYSGDKVPKKTKWIYSISNFGRDAAYNLVALFFMTYVQFSGCLGTDGADYAAQFGVITILVIIGRIWDGVNDFIMGWIVEKCHFKLGKYKPWILIGGVTNAIVVFLMFALRPTGWWYVLAFGIFYFLWDFTFTMNDIGYWSMLPSLTSNEKERNNITSLVSLFSAIGAFSVGGVVPMLVAGDAVNMYRNIALIVACIYLVSQVFVFFMCKEHVRQDSLNERKEEAKFTDMFKLLKTNDQLRVIVIVMFIYYIGSGILNAFGMNYFYLNYNYTNGGTVQFIFTVVYALGSVAATIIYPFLSRKFTRKKLITFTTIMMTVGYALFFFYDLTIGGVTLGFKNAVTSTTINYLDVGVLCILGIIIFSCQYLFYLILIVMMTNTIEYNEFKDGERKESQIFSLRPFTVKIADALKQGLVYVVLVSTGLLAITNKISDLESSHSLTPDLVSSQDVLNGANEAISGASNAGLIGLKAAMALLPLLLFVACFLILKKWYIIDEKYYATIVKDIDERKAQIAQKEGTTK